MAENRKFEAGQRIAIDEQRGVLVIELLCPICEAEGTATAVVPTPATRAWLPVLSRLQELAKKQPALSKLIDKDGRAKLVCAEHGRVLRSAGIWTRMFHQILEQARERRQARERESIAAILGGEKVAELRAVGEEIGKQKRRDNRRTRGEKRDGPPTNPPYDRPGEKRQTEEEIQEASTSEETS